jgi:aspartyl/glutamyl-tRNA(Asn/Gln) amidotransferase C subunit
MNLSDIDRLATLSRLDIPVEEKETVLRDLTAIIGYVDQIQSVQADTASEIVVSSERNIFRNDENPHDSASFTDRLVNEMPDRDGSYLKVPRIL